MTNEKKNLDELISKLVGHGEDPQELELWHKIYDCLNQKQRSRLLQILQKELEELEAIKV